MWVPRFERIEESMAGWDGWPADEEGSVVVSFSFACYELKKVWIPFPILSRPSKSSRDLKIVKVRRIQANYANN